MIDVLNATVLPFSSKLKTSTRDCMHDQLLRKFMDATPLHPSQMWLWFDTEISTWTSDGHIRDIHNSTKLETNRLMLYKHDLAKLKRGKFLGNSIIEFFIWKRLDMLVNLGMKDV
jgi:hypothetical protein